MKKGDRVEITSGPGKGQVGSIFWKGKDKYNGGHRYGVSGDDGETYWVSESDVTASKAKLPDSPTFDKGDRVRFRNRGETGTGTVFWTGKSRSGPGQRLGIRDDSNPEDAVWLDARFASELPPEEDPGAPEPQRSSGRGGGSYQRRGSELDEHGFGGRDSVTEVPADYAPPLNLDDAPPPAPVDDSFADSWAAQLDAEVDDVPF